MVVDYSRAYTYGLLARSRYLRQMYWGGRYDEKFEVWTGFGTWIAFRAVGGMRKMHEFQ